MTKLDILAIGAHPDDVELSCGATLAKHHRLGYRTGIVDLTKGELGTRGTVPQRQAEGQAAAQILGLKVRDNLGLADGFFRNDTESQLQLMVAIRRYQPDVLLANAPSDRHPDHGRAAELARDAWFLAGLQKIGTQDPITGEPQAPWRPRIFLNYLQDRHLQPSLIVDLEEADWQRKMDSIRAHRSQFHDPNSTEPATYISSPVFLTYIEARGREFGHQLGAPYGEAFIAPHLPRVRDLLQL